MKMEDFTRHTEKCFNGEPASCSFACPFHLDIRSFLEKAGKGRWNAAYKELANAVVFPVIVSTLCEQPCRGHCQRTVTGDEAIALRDLESAVIRYAKNRKPESYFIPPKTKSVAVVGAGTAGLSCALSLAQKQFPVTVFERADGWGGSLRNHARFREFDEDIALRCSTVSIDYQFGVEIKTLYELRDFDAIYIATGSGGESFGLLEGWDPELLTTDDSRVFLGGALCGASLMEGIAQGPRLSKTLEVFLQTGKASVTHGGYVKTYCGHTLPHDEAKSSPLIKAASADGYTEEEAKLEAARCFLCDCQLCIDSCEMLKRFNKKPHRMAIEAYTDLQASVLSSRLMTRETYSCNVCGYCKSICPESVDLGELLQFSRSTRIDTVSYPVAFHEFWLREMDFASDEGFFASPPKGKETCEYAFFPGCQLGASRPDYVFRSYDFLKENYEAGIILNCCGAPVYWAGDEKRLRQNLDKIRKCWSSMGQPTLVFACATCESLFYKFLPEIKRVSLYELLAASEKLEPAGEFTTAAIFDPCAARDDHGMETGVRKLAIRAGVSLTELKERNHCCGYGGHMRIANPALYEEIVANRSEASSEPYLVYCVNCREVFTSADKKCAHILDIAFKLDPDPSVPSIHEKRENSLEVKKKLMKDICNEDFKPAVNPWDGLTLIISGGIQKEMDKKLIAASDLKEAIWCAEASEDKFRDDSTGTSLCSLAKEALTYWVQYRKTADDTYEVLSAYCHRMRFNREG